MALALEVKRTARFYTPPVRGSVARTVPYAFFRHIGLCTGVLYARPVDSSRVMMLMRGGFAGLTLLKKWAGDAPRRSPA